MDANTQLAIQRLGDLELAILVSLLAQEHCILSTDHSPHDLRDELANICRRIFGLEPAIIECSAKTTVNEFNEAILMDPSYYATTPIIQRQSSAYSSTQSDMHRSSSPGYFGTNTLDTRRIADVIIAVNLDLAGEHVQIQALELLRSKRIFTRTAMHTTSKDFLFLAVASSPTVRLSHHLNDLFCISHHHIPEDDGEDEPFQDINVSTHPLLNQDTLSTLRHLSTTTTTLTPELAAHLHNLVVFLRNSRFITSGVTATATRHLRKISLVLAPLHGLDYVPPSLVALAARKVYPHRIRLATVETEKSLQWGSEREAVRGLVEGREVGEVIDEVLASLEGPL